MQFRKQKDLASCFWNKIGSGNKSGKLVKSAGLILVSNFQRVKSGDGTNENTDEEGDYGLSSKNQRHLFPPNSSSSSWL